MKTAFLFALTVFGVCMGIYAAESPKMSCDVAMSLFSIACITIGAGLLNYGLYMAADERDKSEHKR